MQYESKRGLILINWIDIESIKSRLVSLSVLFGLFLFVPSLIADVIGVPIGIQATMIVRLVKSNTKLAGKSNFNMLIVYSSKTENQKNRLYQEMKDKAHINFSPESEINLNNKKIDVVYFMPGCEGAAEICKQHKILSIASTAKSVESGSVSVAIASENDKPRIFVNLSSLKAEEQQFSTDILRIAKVFK